MKHICSSVLVFSGAAGYLSLDGERILLLQVDASVLIVRRW
jgi:hypothetical protein